VTRGRGGLALLAAAAALSGCPLPQAVPEIGLNGQVLVPAPRIVYELVNPQVTVVDIQKSCPSQPRFSLSAVIADESTTEAVEARWFVDYDAASQTTSSVAASEFPLPDPDPTNPHRALSPFVFLPGDWQGAQALHVVELVVSNGFYATTETGLPLPNRTPQPGYETQVFRWVFRFVDSGGACAYP
jgi:hypothetical protein